MTSEQNIIKGPPLLEPLPRRSLGEILYESLVNNSNDHPAFIDAHTGKCITYPEILQKSCSLAEALRKLEYGVGTVVSISSENNLEFFIPIIASLYVGCTVAPLNHNYTPLELSNTLSITKPKIIFCSKAAFPKYSNLKKKSNFIEKIIVIDSDEKFEDAIGLNELIDTTLNGQVLNRFSPVKLNPDEEVAFIMCSSGTTGLPKGVMLTHTNIIVTFAYQKDPRYFSPNKSKVNLGILPFFHAYGLNISLMAIIVNELIVLLKAFNDKLFLQTIQDYKITKINLAPPLVVFLAKSPLVNNYDLSSLEEIFSGAAPLGKSIEEALNQRFKIKSMRQGYGLTESTLGVTVTTKEVIRAGSSGQVVPLMSLAVRNPETGAFLGPYQKGEICVKGPLVMKGYYNNPEATRNSFTPDGWLLTGDIGYYDDERFFYVIDRIKELIKYKGFQVAPAEIEALLINHPDIQEAGVIGVPDEIAGELPLAFVVKKSPKSQLSENDVKKFVADQLSSQKQLRGGVIFVKSIPKLPSGKILRRVLREMAKKIKSKL